jgi:hypothetical protein
VVSNSDQEAAISYEIDVPLAKASGVSHDNLKHIGHAIGNRESEIN